MKFLVQSVSFPMFHKTSWNLIDIFEILLEILETAVLSKITREMQVFELFSSFVSVFFLSLFLSGREPKF